MPSAKQQPFCTLQLFAPTDEVGGKVAIEGVAIFKRIMRLRVGHRAALEPAIEHLRHAPQDFARFWRANLQMIDAVAMQVGDWRAAAEALELFDRRWADDLAVVVAHPAASQKSITRFALSLPPSLTG